MQCRTIKKLNVMKETNVKLLCDYNHRTETPNIHILWNGIAQPLYNNNGRNTFYCVNDAIDYINNNLNTGIPGDLKKYSLFVPYFGIIFPF